jgi:hypothetical protein
METQLESILIEKGFSTVRPGLYSLLSKKGFKVVVYKRTAESSPKVSAQCKGMSLYSSTAHSEEELLELLQTAYFRGQEFVKLMNSCSRFSSSPAPAPRSPTEPPPSWAWS